MKLKEGHDSKEELEAPREALFAFAHCVFTPGAFLRVSNAAVKLYSECLCSWLLF